MKAPRTKAEFLERQEIGEFGNRFKIWKNLSDYITTDVHDQSEYLTIRSRERDSPFFIPSVTKNEVVAAVSNLIMKGARYEDLYLQEVPPSDMVRVLNFECGLTASGIWSVRHGQPGTSQNLRHDLEQFGRELIGLSGRRVLHHFLAEEYPTLEDMVYLYPDGVIEATMWPSRLGTDDRRLLIWEVRGY